MKRYWLVVGLLLSFFLITFLFIENLQLSILVNPQDRLSAATWGVALFSVGLLIADVLLPVPSSLVMVANGALFGMVWGTCLSLIGSLGAACFGFVIGRRGEVVLAHFVSSAEQRRANQLLESWGGVAIIVTRPIPILAETTAVMAGASTLGWRMMLLSTLAGSLPTALLYALTGATAVNFDNTILTFGLVLLMAGFFWLFSRYLTNLVNPS